MTDHDERHPGAEIRRAARDLRDTPAGQRLRSRAFQQEHAAEALLRHPDPVMREIGAQLRDGQMRPSDVLRIPEYADAFGRAARRTTEAIDPERVAGELAKFAERSAAETRDRRSPS